MNLLAPLGSLLRRVAAGEFWIEHRDDVDPVSGEDDGRTSDAKTPARSSNDVQSAADGFGPLTCRSYRTTIVDADLKAADLIEIFSSDPNRFSPTSYAAFSPEPGPQGMVVGDDFTVRLVGPWNGPVRVAAVSPTSILLVTRDDHMEAGRIEFSAIDRSPGTIDFVISSQARAGDPAFDTVYHKLRIAKLIQSDMWARVLEAAPAVVGGLQQGRIRMTTTVVHDRSVTDPA